jgi:hexosaminidase
MRILLIAFIFVLSCQCIMAQTIPFMPVPADISYGSGQFRITSDFSLHLPDNCSPRVREAARRFLHKTAQHTTQRIDWLDYSGKGSGLHISSHSTLSLSVHMDESYQLTIDPERIDIKATTDIGILRGLETLLQSITMDSEGFYFPSLQIKDTPRFAWRGLMVDPCRHFIQAETVKRIIDGMAHCKMNVLHWHLSEDQGFRIESRVFPKLHQHGSDGLYYTQEQVKEVIRYADLRGIRVVPEFDIPGHASAWMPGYPELSSGAGPHTIERHYGVFDPTLDPTRKYTYQFLDKLFREMSALFPDAYFHIGGDENNGKQWDANPAIQQFMKKNKLKDNHALQQYFNARVHKILKKHGKIMMGWDEILQPGLDTSVVIHSWRGKEFMQEAAKKGYRTVLSNGYYIDLSQAAAYHYLNDPLPESMSLTEEEKARILGGEATMWAELVSDENVESRIWPRAGAIAERLWSAQNIRSTDDLYRRIPHLENWLELSGSNHRKNRDYMIRRLSGEMDPDILTSFLEWVEPLEGYKRHGTQPRYTSFVPLSRPVDCSLPDAPGAVSWRGYRAEHPDKDLQIAFYRKELERILQLCPIWSQSFSSHPNLQALIPLVDQLYETALAGQLMMESLEKNKQTPQQLVAWKQMLVPYKAQAGEMEIILPDILLEAYARWVP